MRIHSKLGLIAVLLLGAVGADAPEEKRHRDFVPGTKITLKARKSQYFLGENILLDYQIEYHGEGALAVDTQSGPGAPDCTVVALDADGKKATASTRKYQSNGQSGRPLRRGDSVCYTIPLSFYIRLEKPGKYRIRAAHNLYWTERDVAIPRGDPRWAETTIEVVMPDEAQAGKVVERMLRAKDNIERYWTWDSPDFADFVCLRYPVYLPILEKMAADPRGDKRALLGIANNPAPEAAEAIFRLLKTADNQQRKRLVAALCDRLPEPKGVNRPGRRNPIQSEVADDGKVLDRDADPKLVCASWRDDFAVPTRQFARKALADADPELVQCAAYALEAVGVQEDMPDLVAAVSRLVPVVEKTEPPHYIGEVAPVRQASIDATDAIEAMAARGVAPKADPRTPGEIAHFIATLKQRKEVRPEGWEKRCQEWVRQGSPYMRELVLFNTPRPLPSSLVDAYRDGTRKVIATTHDQTAIHVAVQSALELKVPMHELLGLLVDRMDSEEPQLYVHLYSCLGDLLTTGKHENAYAACARTPKKKEMATVKARWKSFLQEHGGAIRNGKRFDPNNDDFRRLMNPEPDE